MCSLGGRYSEYRCKLPAGGTIYKVPPLRESCRRDKEFKLKVNFLQPVLVSLLSHFLSFSVRYLADNSCEYPPTYLPAAARLGAWVARAEPSIINIFSSFRPVRSNWRLQLVPDYITAPIGSTGVEHPNDSTSSHFRRASQWIGVCSILALLDFRASQLSRL